MTARSIVSINISKQVGRNVRAEMVRRGITVEQMAADLGWQQSTLSKRFSRTAWTIDELAQVAALLDVDLVRLLDGVGGTTKAA